MQRAAFYPRQTKHLFADLSVFTSGEGDEVTSPSLEAENEAIEASSSSLEALIATRYMERGCDGSILPTASKNLFADLSVFTSGEGDDATSPSSVAENEPIDASSSSLEALIATS